MSRHLKETLWILVLAAVYFAAGKTGLSLAYVNPSATAVWPPTGVALAALLLRGVRWWPGVFLGAFLVNATTPGYLVNDLFIACGNTLEAVVGAWLVRQFAGDTRFSEQARTVFRFAVLAGIASTALSSSIGATVLCVGKEAAWSQYSSIWITWWLGDMMSNLVIAPLLIVWLGRPIWRPFRAWEALLCCATVLAIDLLVLRGSQKNFPFGDLKYLSFLPILWAAFRFGPHGAVSSAFLTACLALSATLQNRGPFPGPDPNNALLSLQIYVGALTLTGLAVAGIVTERRTAEDRLEDALGAACESEQRERARVAELHTIMQAVPAVIWIAQDPECRVITGNPASYDILRLPREANASKSAGPGSGPDHFEVLSHGVPLRPEELPVQRAARGEEIRNFEEELRFRDGASHYLLGNATPLRDPSGQITGAVAAFVDITARKKAEEALRAREAELEKTVTERTARLRETVQELQTLSYSIAHDMRAPLRAMSAFADLLLEGESTLSPEGHDYCQRIIKGAGRLDCLIHDALNYTKTVLQELPVAPVPLGTVLRGLIDTYPNFHPENAEIALAPDLPDVLGNQSLIVQCFANLLGNAVKFVSPGTKPRIHVWATRQDGYATIFVQDNGIGIPKEHQSGLFAMFHKLDQTYEGTGIGLAIVRKAAERMNGTVGVESDVGAGSRFWVRLPLAPNFNVGGG